MSPYFLRLLSALFLTLLALGQVQAETVFGDRFEFPVQIPSLSVQQSVFNYATDSPLLFSSELSDGSSLSLFGTKTPDGLLGSVTSFRLAFEGNPITSVEAQFDEQGRPTDKATPVL